MNETFSCDCGGPVESLAPDRVSHACRLKGAPCYLSFYDGIERPIEYRRVQVNPALTGGVVKYNWYVAYR